MNEPRPSHPCQGNAIALCSLRILVILMLCSSTVAWAADRTVLFREEFENLAQWSPGIQGQGGCAGGLDRLCGHRPADPVNREAGAIPFFRQGRYSK